MKRSIMYYALKAWDVAQWTHRSAQIDVSAHSDVAIQPVHRSHRKLSGNVNTFPKAINKIKTLVGWLSIEPSSLEVAVRKTALRHTTPEEAAAMRRVESLRSALLTSQDVIEYMDFGAGDAKNPTTLEQSAAGVRKQATVAEVCAIASKPERWARMLFHIVREFRPAQCLELGTCLGISGCYEAAALKLNGAGVLVTLEGADPQAKIAERNFAALGLENVRVILGRFSDTLPGVLDGQTFDYLFIDGHHDGAALRMYYCAILPHLSENAVVLFDDIRWSDKTLAAWEHFSSRPEVVAALDLDAMGVLVLGKKKYKPARFQV